MNEEIRQYKLKILRLELSTSSRSASLSSCVLVVLYLFALGSIDSNLGYSYYFGGTLLLVQTYRSFQSTQNKISDQSWLSEFSVIMTIVSLAWGALVVGNLIQNVGRSQVVILSYTIVMGLIVSGSQSMSNSKKDFFIFQSCMLSSVLLGFTLNSESTTYKVTGALITILFFGFLVIQRKIQTKAWHEKVLHNYELQKIIDTIPGGISVIRDGVYIHANEYLLNHVLQKSNSEQIFGAKLGDLSSQNNSFVQAISQFSNSKESQIKFETELAINNENRHHLVVARNIVRDNIVDTVIATIDIQDLKNREIENKINLAKLEHNSKMAALGEMSSGLAHEINNPLAVICGRIQILKQQSESQNIDTASLRKGFDIIEKTTFRIAKIIKGLKTFARDADNDDFTQGLISDLIEDTLSFCEARFKNFGVTFNYDADSIKGYVIECRLTQLSQVLLNALNNSYDSVSNLDEKWIDLTIEKTNGMYVFKITDSGKGIPVHLRSKLMQPFFTTKDVGKGTGLGLSLSKNIVDVHQGQIYFNFEHPTNTQLVIEIPEYQAVKKAS